MKLYSLFFFVSSFLNAYDPTTLHRYFWANYNLFSGNIETANSWYSSVFASNNQLYTYKGYLTFLFHTKQFNKIKELIPLIEKKFENDVEVQLLFIATLEKCKEQNLADNRLLQFSQTCKNNDEITLRAAQVYIKRQEPENALLTIDAFLNNTPRKINNFVFYFLKSQIYLQLGNTKDALANIELCLEMHQKFDKGWLLFAILQEQQGNLQKAIAGYNTFLELAGNNSSVEKHLLGLMLKQQTNNKKTNLTSFHKSHLEQAYALCVKKNYAQALAHINTYLNLYPKDTEARLLKLNILTSLKNYDMISHVIIPWFNENTQDDLWPKTIYLLSRQTLPITESIKIFELLESTDPKTLWPRLYKADIQIQHNKHTDAINTLEKTLLCSIKDVLKAKILYQLSLLYYEQKNYSLMHETLEKALSINAECPHLNNMAAYYWATKGNNLIKARKYVTIALKKDNTNPYFIDTHAVILYKEKKYQEAQELLTPLIPYNNATFLLHLAKIHYKLHNIEKAQSFIEKALTFANNHEKEKIYKMNTILTHHEK